MIGPSTVFCCSQIGRPVVGIYKTLTDTYMNVEIGPGGRAVSFLGIFFSNFRYSNFAV
jgi:hypothetical protein